MDSDILFVIGIVLAILSVPAMFSAYSERRAPRVATFSAIAAVCLIIWAVQTQPGGYTIEEIPEVFVRVVAKFL